MTGEGPLVDQDGLQASSPQRGGSHGRGHKNNMSLRDFSPEKTITWHR